MTEVAAAGDVARSCASGARGLPLGARDDDKYRAEQLFAADEEPRHVLRKQPEKLVVVFLMKSIDETQHNT